MDIDVKNSFERINNAVKNTNCKEVDLTKEIFCFINKISKSNAEDRFNYFSQIYLKDGSKYRDFAALDLKEEWNLLRNLCEIDNRMLKGSNVKTSKLLIAFYTTLGKYYLSSGADRDDINRSEFLDTVVKMEDYVNANLQQNVIDEKKVIKFINSNGKEESPDESQIEAIELPEEPEETLEELQEKLNAYIGLEGVKQEVAQLINLIKVQKKGEEFGEKLPPLSLHLVFYGNPGTGKTTIARILAKIYKSLGVLSKGQMIETDRGRLVAGHVGQTAIKTQEVIDQALGGILFIDEAYTLTHSKGETDFGQESVDTILKAMEDNRDDFIVIVAGYPDLMKEFIASNPGLKSRFNKYINFEDYKPEELLEIFKYQCQENNFTLDTECETYLTRYFEDMYNNRKEDYANGRDVRNYFENMIKARANRLAEILDGISREEYLKIKLSDLEEAATMRNEIC